MTTNLLQNINDSTTREAMGLAIGETDANIFNCPVCARPLSEGASRCPGCGTRLILGVRVKRAGAILALGVAIGVLVGGLSTAAAITLSLNDPVLAAGPVATAAPAATAAPSATPGHVVLPDPPANAAAVSALSGTAVVNGRIAVDAATLASTIARSNATSIDIARALRSLAADAALGIDLAGRLAPWSDAAQVQGGLEDFYRAMAQAARMGLRSSLNDNVAYRKAGANMITVLSAMGTIDAQSRTLAGTVGLELPPVVLPTS